MRGQATRRAGRTWAAAAVMVVAAGCGGSGSGATPGGSSPNGSGGSSSPAAGVSPAAAFLQGYVAGDGAVIRHDQGGDVVSEGQAYGMLAAQLAGQDSVASTIWAWTRQHLQRPDGLLSYHADASGKVLDSQAASDADTLAAYALLRSRGSQAASMHRDGRRLAAAVLAHETLRDTQGRLVLAAGPWAVAQQVVDPSYWMPSVFDDLAHLTGDRRWAQLATTSVALTDTTTQGGKTLPPDWGKLQGDRVVPTGQGGGGGTPQYGPDAQRVPLWFAAACDQRATRLAGAWWALLQQSGRSSATALSTAGDTVDGSASTVALLASAAAASAAGDTAGAAQLRTGAAQANAGHPTYYGAAWLALADGLRTGNLGGCGGS